MRENDFNYIKEVTEFFNSTRSEDNPKGNIRNVGACHRKKNINCIKPVDKEWLTGLI